MVYGEGIWVHCQIQVIFILRLYAIYSGSWIVVMVMGCLLVVEVGVKIVRFIYHFPMAAFMYALTVGPYRCDTSGFARGWV